MNSGKTAIRPPTLCEIVAFTVIAISILGFGLISGRVQKSVITPPMVFVLFGLLISSNVFGLVTFDIENRFIRGRPSTRYSSSPFSESD